MVTCAQPRGLCVFAIFSIALLMLVAVVFPCSVVLSMRLFLGLEGAVLLPCVYHALMPIFDTQLAILYVRWLGTFHIPRILSYERLW